MSKMRNLLVASLGVAALATALATAPPADAAKLRMCAPSRAGVAAGPAIWTSPITTSTYALDVRGCAILPFAEYGTAQAAGFITNPLTYILRNFQSTTPNSSIVMPASTRIDWVVVEETSGAAVTGGFAIGTTSGGVESVALTVVGASASVSVPDVSMTKRAFSTSSPQTLYIKGDNSPNHSNLNVTIRYSYY